MQTNLDLRVIAKLAILVSCASLSFAQSQNVGAVGRGVSISFQNTDGSADGAVSVGFHDAAGTIQVTTNIGAAAFTIAGPATYTGSGQLFTKANAPAGTYTITFGAVSCYAPPVSQVLTLAVGQTITFNGLYQGAASVSVNVSPAGATSATFSISPPIPGMRSTGPYPVTQTGTVPQSYTVTFNAVNGFQSPSPVTLSPSAACSLVFNGTYSQAVISSTGILSITLNMAGGYAIYQSGTNALMATNTSLVSAQQLPAPATYVVKYTALPGYYTPSSQTVTLKAMDSIPLSGIYRRLILVSFTGWSNAPNSSPDLINCMLYRTNSNLGSTGSGIRYPDSTWSSASQGMISLLAEIRDFAVLAQGANMAGFTFYSTDNQNSNACTTASDSVHVEARNWFNSQNVTADDYLVVIGHSYGGNRARLFVDYLKSVGYRTDYLAVVDPIDWDTCDIFPEIGAYITNSTNLCDQSHAPDGLPLIYPDTAATAQSFAQTVGLALSPIEQAALSLLLGITTPGSIPLPKGYTVAPASVIPRQPPIDHRSIDTDFIVHTNIKTSLTNLINGPQVTATAGTAMRTNGVIAMPLTFSVAGKLPADAITITSASLNGVSSTSVPILIGSLPANTSAAPISITFPGTAATSGSVIALIISGQFSYGHPFSINIRLKMP
jgi:hypothetical protein